MTYADTDFFLALMKESDWLKDSAKRLIEEHKGKLWTSPATLIELLLVAAEFDLDPERLLVDVLELVELKGGDPSVYLKAAYLIKSHGSRVFDSLHAAFCGKDDKIISSDKIFDKLGLDRIDLRSQSRLEFPAD